MRDIFVLVRVEIVSKSKIFVVFKKDFFYLLYIMCPVYITHVTIYIISSDKIIQRV